MIVVDPGHGGSNVGCVNVDGTYPEKRLTLEVATALRVALAGRLPRAEVYLTREVDGTGTLAERTALANELGADLLVSIHANASPGHDQTGFETFVLDGKIGRIDVLATAARDEHAASAAGVSGSDPVGLMLRELRLMTNQRRSGQLAAAIQRQQAARFPQRVNRGVRQGPFDVLMGAQMPAVLTEIGFLDHAGEGESLRSAAVQRRIADGLADAIVDYYRQLARPG